MDEDRKLKQLQMGVRLALADHPEANELVDGVNVGDDLYEMSLRMALMDWNGSPPILGDVTFETHPREDLLYKKMAVDLLRTEVIGRIRNSVDVSDGGASVNNTAKAQMLMGVAEGFERLYEAKKREYKIAINLRGGYGGLPSEYSRYSRA